MGYAVVLGEALIDLLDAECEGQPVFRQAIGGGPLNVAVGVARLGGTAQLVGSLGDDVLAGRIRDFLADAGVGLAGAVTVPAPTTLAVTTHTGAEPDFRFYGEPPSYGLLAADDLDVALVDGADGALLRLDRAAQPTDARRRPPGLVARARPAGLRPQRPAPAAGRPGGTGRPAGGGGRVRRRGATW